MTVIQDAPPDTVAGRVDRGFRHLDERAPGWRDYIKRGLLDVSSANWCVLGQLEDHPAIPFANGDSPFDRVAKGLGLSTELCREYGFMAPHAGLRGGAEYAALTREWDRRISACQAGAFKRWIRRSFRVGR